MSVLYWLIALGAVACLALWAWLYFDAPECEDECQRECCADNSLDVPEDAR